MLPGKKYTPEDILKLLRKRFWVVVVPWAVVAAATAGITRRLPDQYKSIATIQVVPPQVPESIVRQLSNVRFEDRLKATEQSILSRTRLERLIQDFDLYRTERQHLLMEEVYERMRTDIKVTPIKGDAFTVQYIGRDPIQVQKVAEKLAGYFKDESVRQGEVRAEGTNSFLESAVEEAHRKLVDSEEKLKEYRLRHAGELPTQAGSNGQAIQTITVNLSNMARAIDTDKSSQVVLERQIQAEEAQVDPVLPLPAGSDPPMAVGTAAQRLKAAQNELNYDLTVRRLKPEHYEVKALNAMIAKLTTEANAEALQAPVALGGAVSPPDQARQKRLAGMREDLENLKKRIASNQEDEKKLRALADTYQAKVDQIPIREAEMVEIQRDYETFKRIYENLLAQREAATMSVNLERRQIGEQFTIIDQARIPERPFSPDRLVFNLIGILGGLALGLGLVALLEYRDGTFKTDYELAGILSLPVLAVVPLMRSDVERRSNFRKQFFINLGLGSAVALCLAVLTYTIVVR